MPARSMPPPGLWLLALLTLSGTLGTHMFIPALPDAASDLGASKAAIQLTISVYVIGLAVGQLIYGPLADYFGRRPVLVGGLTLYVLAGIAAALAPDVNALIGARLFQALGACGTLVLGRAMARDLAGAQAAAGRLALLNVIVSGGPAVAPVIGALLSLWLDWRAVVATPSLIGLILLALVYWRVPETVQAGRELGVRTLAREYGHLVRTPLFLCNAVGGGCTTTALYGFLAAAPFIFQQMGRTAAEAGFWCGTVAISVASGSAMAQRLVRHFTVSRLLIGASLVGATGGLALLTVGATGQLSVAAVMVAITIFAIGNGLSSPLALSRSVGINPRLIGSAAGLHGFMQQGIGALCAALAGLGSNPALTAGLVVGGSAMTGVLAFTVADRLERRA